MKSRPISEDLMTQSVVTEQESDPGNSPEPNGGLADSGGGDIVFDLEKLRLSQNFAAELGVKKRLITVRVRKPHRQEFFRVHPDDTYTLTTGLLELKEERETYLVDPSLWSELPSEIQPRQILLAVTRQDTVFLWPLRLPDQDGRFDDWGRSAMEAASLAKDRWTKLVANMSNGAFDLFEASGKIPDPEWPEEPFSKLIEIAFRDRYIQSMDHPVVKRLLGFA